MGYRGKVTEQNECRELRAQGWTYNEIAAEVGVSKSSVSLWCRDIEVDEAVWAQRVRANKNRGARVRRPSSLTLRKQAEIDELLAEGRRRIGSLSERDLLVAGTALYAGEGGKRDGSVRFTNSDPRMILFFVIWLRRFFDIEEARLRLRLYLHEGLDLDAANRFWSELTGIPVERFRKPYRAVPDPSIRKAKHVYGCPCIVYDSSRTHRAVMGLMSALLSFGAIDPG